MEDIYEKIKASELKRIADALEEVLRLVKEDQERSRKYMEEPKVRENPESVQTKHMEQPEEGDMRDHFKKAVVNE